MLDFILQTAFLAQLTTAAPIENFETSEKPAALAEKFTAEPIELQVKAAAAMDLASGQIFWEQNAQTALPMASLTKIMTAVVTLENNPDLNKWVTVPDEAIDTPGNKVWFYQYEKFKLRDLLAAALIKSGNDAARALAIITAGSEEKFAQKMNTKAAVLGLKNTHFMNATGLDDDFHFSTAHDLLILTKYALQNPVFREIVGTNSLGIWSWDGVKRELYTTNKMMTDREPGDVWGVKTGTTKNAGQCLITLRRDAAGHEILGVVLAANNRWLQMRRLTDWIWAKARWG